MDATDNRTVLMNAALRLFSEKGYDAVSVEALRKAAGLSNGSFFHLYPNKAALAADLLVASVTDYQTALLTPLKDTPTAADGVARIVSAKIDWVIANPERGRFMLGEARSAWFALAAEPLKALNARFYVQIDAWRAPLADAGALTPLESDLFVMILVGPTNLVVRHYASGLRDAPSALERSELIAAAQRALGCAG